MKNGATIPKVSKWFYLHPALNCDCIVTLMTSVLLSPQFYFSLSSMELPVFTSGKPT
jgi:hypothetical protein